MASITQYIDTGALNDEIRAVGEKDSYGHEKCLRVCLSDRNTQCITKEQALTIQVINSLRDAAQHYMLQVSEQ